MFDVGIGDKCYRVDFEHFVKNQHAYGRGLTLCSISEMNNGPDETLLIAQGLARCSEKDSFERAVGRKVSLAHALEKTSFTKDQRKVFWYIYFQCLSSSRANTLQEPCKLFTKIGKILNNLQQQIQMG